MSENGSMNDEDEREYEMRRARWAAMDNLQRRAAAGELRAEELGREFRLFRAFVRRLAASIVRHLAFLRSRTALGERGRHGICRPGR